MKLDLTITNKETGQSVDVVLPNGTDVTSEELGRTLRNRIKETMIDYSIRYEQPAKMYRLCALCLGKGTYGPSQFFDGRKHSQICPHCYGKGAVKVAGH
jgi:DnaJ-class molecular chaperone